MPNPSPSSSSSRAGLPNDDGSALDDLQRRAATDPDFRAQCLSAPHDAVEAVTGRPVPPDFTIRFVERAGADVTVVLRDPVEADDDELSEDDLDRAAGGTCLWWDGDPLPDGE